MADVAVKDFGNLIAALDFAAFVINEFDVVADVLVQVFKDVFHDAVRHADQCRRLRIKMFWNARKPAASLWESFMTAAAGISASMRLTA